MRRIYYTTPKKKTLMREALLNLRRVRRSVDPGLLEDARRLIAEQAEKQRDTPDRNGKVSVDRQKTLSIIMKFVENQPDRALRSRIKSLLNEELF